MKKLLLTALFSLGAIVQIQAADTDAWLEKIDLKKAKIKLTLEELKELKTEGEYRDAKLHYSVGPSTIKLKESEKKKYARKEESPFKICAELEEITQRKGKKPQKKRLSGRATILVFNDKGEKVEGKTSLSLSKLCPT